MKKIKIGVFLRIILYVIVILSLVILKYTNIFNIGCYIYSRTGIYCPTCGFTRAMKAILNFDILSAIEYNSFFTLILLPIFIYLALQDIIIITYNIVKNKNLKSYVDIIFGA